MALDSYSLLLMVIALFAIVAVLIVWLQIRWELREMQHTIDRMKDKLP